MKKCLCIYILLCFTATSVLGPQPVYAQEFALPVPGQMVALSPAFNPPILRGLKVNPDNPFRFEFILDKGDAQADLKEESKKLIKYFLASLTVPERDLWVNLSPYEKNRIIPQGFGLTEMGRDLLAEDYILKQITASLMYPEGETGKKFWKQVYSQAAQKFGTTDVPVNTFNKVWIVPEKAVVYENAKAGTAYVIDSKLKVMLDQDYVSAQKHQAINNDLNSQMVRQIILPELTKEVNDGKNFAQLRQVYNSLILANWYKKKIKDSILSQVYSDRNKTNGVGYGGTSQVESIYNRYLQAFKKGVYNYIKEDIDPVTQTSTPRKYFSGGVNFFGDVAMTTTSDAASLPENTQSVVVDANIQFENNHTTIGKIIRSDGLARAMLPIAKLVLKTASLSGRLRGHRLIVKTNNYIVRRDYRLRLWEYTETNWIDLPDETKTFLESTGINNDVMAAAKRSGKRAMLFLPENQSLLRKGQAYYLFQYGIPTMMRILDPKELKKYLPLVADISRAMSAKPWDAYSYQPSFAWEIYQAKELGIKWPEIIAEFKRTVDFTPHAQWLPAMFREPIINLVKKMAQEKGAQAANLLEYSMHRAGKNINSIQDVDNWAYKINRIIDVLQNEQFAVLSNYLSNDNVLKAFWDAPVDQFDNRYKIGLILARSVPTSQDREMILAKFFDTYIFAAPGELDLPTVNALNSLYQQESDFKYFLYYTAVNNTSAKVKARARAILEARKSFEFHTQIDKELGGPNKKALIIINANDGLGDELIHADHLISRLLDYNPAIQITVMTTRDFLYQDHPNLHPINIKEPNKTRAVMEDTYSAIFDFYRNDKTKFEGDENLENDFFKSKAFHKAYVYVHSSARYFTFSNIRINGKEENGHLGLDNYRVRNVYRIVHDMVAEVVPASGERSKGSYLVPHDYAPAQAMWDALMKQLGVEGQDDNKVILLNPYGGTSEFKGIQRVGKEATPQLAEENTRLRNKLKAFIIDAVRNRGEKVVIFPNHREWATKSIVEEFIKELPVDIQSCVAVMPEPGKDNRLYKYFLKIAGQKGARLFTVDGGLMHLSWLLGFKRVVTWPVLYDFSEDYNPLGEVSIPFGQRIDEERPIDQAMEVQGWQFMKITSYYVVPLIFLRGLYAWREYQKRNMHMATRRITVNDDIRIHTAPSVSLSKIASYFQKTLGVNFEVRSLRLEKEADLSNPLAVMSLGIGNNEEIEVSARGMVEESKLEEALNIIKRAFQDSKMLESGAGVERYYMDGAMVSSGVNNGGIQKILDDIDRYVSEIERTRGPLTVEQETQLFLDRSVLHGLKSSPFARYHMEIPQGEEIERKINNLLKRIEYLRENRPPKTKEVRLFGHVDWAMSAEHKNGGIDLRGSQTEVLGAGNIGIKFHLDAAQLAQLQHSTGFVPVIISVRPLTNLKAFLGAV